MAAKNKEPDMVNHPPHYNEASFDGVETIDVMRTLCKTEDEFRGALKLNVGKYLHRYRLKGKPLQDLGKARWYLDKLIEFEEEQAAKDKKASK